ncbi:unnamed protein product [Paramecium sonneborni]|uniref:Uncharacterized protein n=1 Tax=Paramecium sonneborni TaxID=65129 RepID=A0A8S1M3S0_9CILI|nr:unnamed protein product [Paramecium sonneborni]
MNIRALTEFIKITKCTSCVTFYKDLQQNRYKSNDFHQALRNAQHKPLLYLTKLAALRFNTWIDISNVALITFVITFTYRTSTPITFYLKNNQYLEVIIYFSNNQILVLLINNLYQNKDVCKINNHSDNKNFMYHLKGKLNKLSIIQDHAFSHNYKTSFHHQMKVEFSSNKEVGKVR